MERTEQTLYLGPPGTGKTTKLINRVKGFIEQGVEPDRIAYVSFTRKAAQEARNRIQTEMGSLDTDDFPHFNTLHAEAFMLLGLSRHEVMRTEDYIEIGEALGWATFKGQYSEYTERCDPRGGLGDRCLFIYQFAKSRMISLQAAYDIIGDTDVSIAFVKHFVATLESFKQERHKLDFTDFLEACKTELDIHAIIIDEAQDLTPQQWLFAKQLGAAAQVVIMAGDDDQSIFEWAGADIRKFMQIIADVEVLPKSYRLPRRVYEVCTQILAGIQYRYDKTWQPDNREGLVKNLMHLNDVDLTSGDWLLLARNQYQLQKLVALAEEQGVVYNYQGKESNQQNFIQAVVTYHALLKGWAMPAGKVRNMYSFMYGPKDAPPIETGQKYGREDLVLPFEGSPPWFKVMPFMSDAQINYIIRLKRNGQPLTHAGNITISTIHGVKGGEATNVLILPDMSKRVYQAYQYERDQELRVWYVAASRAKQNLYLAPAGNVKHFKF